MKIKVKVIPRAKINKIENLDDKSYRVHLTSPPLDGKANALLIKLLSKYFHISKSKVTIISGEKSRNKTVEVNVE
ncbi:DUF167 domain-containing protein [bacterium]|nr:DUF167 domain-containing protein [bacterium]